MYTLKKYFYFKLEYFELKVYKLLRINILNKLVFDDKRRREKSESFRNLVNNLDKWQEG
jgi:hypothetical protein